MNSINEYSSQYMDTFESPQDEYTRSDEFKTEFYSNLKKCLKERDYRIVTQIINGSSYEQVGEKLGLSSQNVKNKFNDAIKRLSTNRYFKDIISALLRGDYTASNVRKIKRDERQRSENQYRQRQLKKLSQDEWFNELKNRNYEDAKEYAYYKYGIKLESRNMKKLVKLTESDLHRIVKESVNRILKEGDYSPNDDGTFMDMNDRSTFKINGTYHDKDAKAIKKREKAMMDYCQELIWACHDQGILPELLMYMRAFEKQHDIDIATETYFPLDRAPMYDMNIGGKRVR